MEKLAYFFEHIHSLQRMLILAGGLAFFWIFEGLIPLFRFNYKKYQHAGINLFFTLTTVIINLAFAFLIVKASRYVVAHKFGLLYVFFLPQWVFFVLGLMILDLISAWFVHWLEHKIKWMWKFHIIHHADTWVDTTTANRHHPGESIFRAFFTLVSVIVAGAPMWLVLLYQSLSVLLSQFNHANISLPKWIDIAMSWIIVSPNMHKVHHHYVQPLTDTNYGNIFSLWDRIFGTFAHVKHTNELKYGIDIFPGEEENNQIIKLLSIPFDEYRPPGGAKFSNDDNR